MKGARHITFIENNHLTAEGISLYADGIALKKIEMLPDEILEHVENCELCRNEVIATYEIINNLDYTGDISNHPFFSKSQIPAKANSVSSRFWISIAASVIVLLGIFYLIYLKHINKSESIVKNKTENMNVTNNSFSQNHINEGDSIVHSNNKRDENELFAHNDSKYKPNELFESLLESELRGSGFEVYTPGKNVQLNKNEKVVFTWSNPDKLSLRLIVFNNSAEKIFEADEIKGEAYKINSTFLPGLYYWKIIRNDELLKIGKFIVK